MNKDRRKRLSKIATDLDEVIAEEQDARESLPENLQEGERAEKMDEGITALEDAKQFIEETIEL